MLVLSRKKGEKVVFTGLAITIEVLEIKGNKIRLGITAPDDVEVLRDELLPQAPGTDVPDQRPAPKPKRNRRR